MAETHTEFFTADVGSISIWRVESHTARTWKVVRDLTHGRQWRRLVRMADIGHTFHVTPLAALSAIAQEERERIKFAKVTLQRHRTSLGMIESQMRELPGGSELIDLSREEHQSDPARLTDSESGKATGSAKESPSICGTKDGE